VRKTGKQKELLQPHKEDGSLHFLQREENKEKTFSRMKSKLGIIKRVKRKKESL
jgi:hypothetical protein